MQYIKKLLICIENMFLFKLSEVAKENNNK